MGFPIARIASSHGRFRTTVFRTVSEMLTRIPATMPPRMSRPVLIRPIAASFVFSVSRGEKYTGETVEGTDVGRRPPSRPGRQTDRRTGVDTHNSCIVALGGNPIAADRSVRR